LVSEDIPSRIGELFYTVHLTDNQLNTTFIYKKTLSSLIPVFNFEETYDFLVSESRSDNKKVEIKINNEDLNIEVR
jgi:hypothetical protein